MKLIDFLKDLDNFSLLIVAIMMISYLLYDYFKNKNQKTYIDEVLEKKFNEKTDLIVKELTKLLDFLKSEDNHPCMASKAIVDRVNWENEVRNALKEFKNRVAELIKDNDEINKNINELIRLIEKMLDNRR